MKIKTKELSYDKVLALPKERRFKPRKPMGLLRCLIRLLSIPELMKVNFKCRKIGMDKLKRNEPCLILMNHSSFIDFKIAYRIFFPRSMNIVSTSDGFVGKKLLMKLIGCMPTAKFVSDYGLVRNLVYTVNELKSSVLMYPEASYSFDGTATPLPESVGKLLKLLNVPVIFVRTYGAFHLQPLYNSLKKRKVKVSADVKYLLSPEEIAEKSAAELNEILGRCFTFDHFRWQQQEKLLVKEGFRADNLNRALYKCPRCRTEGKTLGKDDSIRCGHCGVSYTLTQEGYLQASEGETEFPHIPDWYQWQRECVRQELLNGSYGLDVPVDIYVLRDTKAIYHVGSGHLRHDCSGFQLTGCEGKLDYKQSPDASYSLYSDFYWYEIGDMISIGKSDLQYYCFPKDGNDHVAKTRLATEELYKLRRSPVKV